MSFFKNIAEGLKINQKAEDDEFFLDDDYYDDEADYDEEPARASSGFFGKKQQNVDSQNESRSGGLFSRPKITPMPNAAMQVTMKKPKTINDSREICDDLINGKAVVINLEGVNSDMAQRITDFTFGAVYSLDGDIQMISKYIIIASPDSVKLSGDFVQGFGMDNGSGAQSASASYFNEPRAARASGGYGYNG